jgi:hypothetical protein
MKPFDDLMQSYLTSNLDASVVDVWYRMHVPSSETLSALAESIGAEFLAGRVSFVAANGLLNQLMPLAGFEAAPPRFWQFYVAFEDSEVSTSPDSAARPAVAALFSGAA